MKPRGEITTRSALDGPALEVWRWATSPEGVNFELGPLLRMSVPAGFSGELEEVAPGERLGRSWLRLFGIVPIDYDDLSIVRVDPGRAFLERSTMLSHRVWEHERTVDPLPSGCVVTDRIAFVPRLGAPARVSRPVLAAVFRHRHARLRGRFGGRDLGQRAT